MVLMGVTLVSNVSPVTAKEDQVNAALAIYVVAKVI